MRPDLVHRLSQVSERILDRVDEPAEARGVELLTPRGVGADDGHDALPNSRECLDSGCPPCWGASREDLQAEAGHSRQKIAALLAEARRADADAEGLASAA